MFQGWYCMLFVVVLVDQTCLTLCSPMVCSLPGSSLHGILQARILEWVAISFSNMWKWKVKVKLLSCVWLSEPMDCSLPGSSIPGIFQARVLERGAIAFSDCRYLLKLIYTLTYWRIYLFFKQVENLIWRYGQEGFLSFNLCGTQTSMWLT